MLDPTTFKKLTPAQQGVVLSMLRRRAPSWSYASIGQQVPGIPRSPHRAYRLEWTGRTEDSLHHRIVSRKGKRIREQFKVPVRVCTLKDMRVPKAVRQLHRQMKGLPKNP